MTIGPKGDRGAAGEGISDIVGGPEGVLIKTTAGREFAVPIGRAEEDDGYLPFGRWCGPLQEGDYRRGDVVRHVNALLVAKRDLTQSGAVADAEDWDVMIRAPSAS